MTWKKKISLGLVCLMTVSVLSACNGTVDPTTTSSSSTPSTDDDVYHSNREIPGDEAMSGKIGEADKEHSAESVDWNGPAGYVIVIPNGNSDCRTAAEELKTYFAENAKAELAIVTDKTAAVDKEILIGATNRETYTAEEGEYFAKISGEKLVFGGGHNVTVKKAVQIYTRLQYKEGKAYTFSGKSDFTAEKLGYKYVWGDEFEETALNTTLWNRATKMAATAEAALDDTEKTTKIENGYLKMFAKRNWDPKQAGVEFLVPWSVTTSKTMSYKYGYVEMRAKVPFIRGVWPSFWTSSSGALNNENNPYDYTTEIDIFEVFSSRDTLSPNIHKWYYDGNHTQWADENEIYTFDPFTVNDEYHIYGFEWTKKEIKMYIDGKCYYTYDLTKNFDGGKSGMSGFDQPIYLIFNNHLFTGSSDWKPYSGCEINSDNLPAEYVIDYVRLYQKNDGVCELNLAK